MSLDELKETLEAMGAEVNDKNMRLLMTVWLGGMGAAFVEIDQEFEDMLARMKQVWKLAGRVEQRRETLA